MNQKVVKFGEGKVAISAGIQVPDMDTVVGLLVLEDDKGMGAIGASVPERPEGLPLFPGDVSGVILEFSNVASVNVVIEQLEGLREQFVQSLENVDTRRGFFEKGEAAIAEREKAA